jgi:hypothetical protein
MAVFIVASVSGWVAVFIILRDHGHPLTGCDVIVCWRHNWDKCPDHIEVLELSIQIKSSPTPD